MSRGKFNINTCKIWLSSCPWDNSLKYVSLYANPMYDLLLQAQKVYVWENYAIHQHERLLNKNYVGII